MEQSKCLVILVTVLFYAVCIGGCLWQLGSLSSVFFEFKTATEISANIPTIVPSPALSICFRYVDVINKDMIRQRVRSEMRRANREVGDKVDWQNFVTIRDMFRLTPATVSLMKHCQLREPHKYTYLDLSGSKCDEHFYVSKYYFLEYICYRFTVQSELDAAYDYHKVAYSTEKAGTMFQINFNLTVFGKVRNLRVVVHSPGSLPFRSMAMTPVVWRSLRLATQKATFNKFILGYKMTTINSQPAPFITNCIHSSQFVCQRECMNNLTLKAFGKYPFDFAIDWPLDRSPLSVTDLSNMSVSNTLLKFKKKCDKKCWHTGCNSDFTQTRVAKQKDPDKMSFQMEVPREPFVTIDHNPSMTVTTYIITVSSILGTWFGFSLLKANPFKPDLKLVDGWEWKSTKSDHICRYCIESRTFLRRQLAQVSMVRRTNRLRMAELRQPN